MNRTNCVWKIYVQLHICTIINICTIKMSHLIWWIKNQLTFLTIMSTLPPLLIEFSSSIHIYLLRIIIYSYYIATLWSSYFLNALTICYHENYEKQFLSRWKSVRNIQPHFSFLPFRFNEITDKIHIIHYNTQRKFIR